MNKNECDFDVFLSYNWDHKAHVQRLYDYLTIQLKPVFLKSKSQPQQEMFTLEFGRLLFERVQLEGQLECIDRKIYR